MLLHVTAIRSIDFSEFIVSLVQADIDFNIITISIHS